MAGWVDEDISDDAGSAQAPAEASPEQVTGESGQEAQSQDPAGATAEAAADEATAEATDDSSSEPPVADQSTKSVPLPALQAERKQKQELKQQLEAAERRARELQQMLEARDKAASKPAEPDPYENDDSILDDIPGALKSVRKRTSEELNDWKIRASEELVREQYSDYDDLLNAHYLDAVKADPNLVHRVANAAMPALTAYKAVKKYLETKDFNPQEAKNLKEENARLLKEIESLKKKGTVVVPAGVSNARAQNPVAGGNTQQQHRASPKEIWPLS